MIEGPGSRVGSGSESIHLTSGSGSGRQKTTWIRWIRNTGGRYEEVQNAVPKEERAVVWMAGEVVERVGCAAQHVQAGAHGVGVVAQRVHPVLLRHEQGVALSLLDEADEQGDRRVLPRKENGYFQSVFRIRIRIGSGLNQVSGSGSTKALKKKKLPTFTYCFMCRNFDRRVLPRKRRLIFMALLTVWRLKGPKHKKFVTGIFTQIRPVWISELETRPKTSKYEWLGPSIFAFIGEFCLAMSATEKNFFFSYLEKNYFRLLLYKRQ